MYGPDATLKTKGIVGKLAVKLVVLSITGFAATIPFTPPMTA